MHGLTAAIPPANRRKLYALGFAILIVWFLPSLFTFLIVSGLLFTHPHADLVFQLVQGQVESVLTTTTRPVIEPPPSLPPPLSTCKASLKHGGMCRMAPCEGSSYCKRHAKMLARNPT